MTRIPHSMFDQASDPAVPTGVIFDFAGSTAPNGWLLCAGQAVSRTTFAALFAVIGTTYGAGDGSTTFNVPDLRGRIPVGKDDMGGTAANRMTTGGSGVNGASLGAVGGSETHTLTTAQLASHSHQQTGNTGQATSAGSFSVAGTLNTLAINNTQTAGSGNAHNNTQPSLILNKIIRS